MEKSEVWNGRPLIVPLNNVFDRNALFSKVWTYVKPILYFETVYFFRPKENLTTDCMNCAYIGLEEPKLRQHEYELVSFTLYVCLR